MRIIVAILTTLLVLTLSACSANGEKAAPVPAESSAGSQDDDPGLYGPELGQAHVVRSLTIKVTGGMIQTTTGKKEDGKTTLSGECKPDLFANLGFDIGAPLGDRTGVGFVTIKPITLGQTGEIDLDWVLFETVKINNTNVDAKRFKSEDGTLTLTTHNPTKGSRRMTGTIVAKNLMPLDEIQAKPVDLEASFDTDFSCGVK